MRYGWQTERSLALEARFRERVIELGGTPAWESWEGSSKRHKVICRKGHKASVWPSNVTKGGGICRTCAGQDPRAAEATFRKRLEEMGATPAYEKWINARTGHKVICANGHECNPRPDDLRTRKNPCGICAGNNAQDAERRYRLHLAEIGAIPAWDIWAGTNKPNKVICPVGHECTPRPSHVMGGRGLCRTCARVDPVAAEAAFRSRLEEFGVTIEWTGWRGARVKYRATCAAGHECWPTPDSLQSGRGPCRACAGRDPVEAEAKARRRLQNAGFTAAWEQWLGAGVPHRTFCPAGHEVLMRPSQLARKAYCPHCAGTTTEAIENAFRESVIKQGGTPAWSNWLGAIRGHKVICKAGHTCYPTPNSIQQGGGICRFCKGKSWDVYYIVANDNKREMKFGITSGDPKGRLAVHKNRGYSRVVLVAESSLALKVETETKRALRAAGFQPTKGREYFPLTALNEALEVAISYGLDAAISPEGWQALQGKAVASRPIPAC